MAGFEEQFGQSESAFKHAHDEVQRLCKALVDRDTVARPHLLGTPEFSKYLESRSTRLRTLTTPAESRPTQGVEAGEIS